MNNKNFDKLRLVGRDPTKGLLAFKTGVILTQRDKMSKRNSKAARREKRNQIQGDFE